MTFEMIVQGPVAITEHKWAFGAVSGKISDCEILISVRDSRSSNVDVHDLSRSLIADNITVPSAR